ncbi:14366_t:CDS:2, partial [Racocetra persica]
QKVGMKLNEIVYNRPSNAIASPSRVHVESEFGTEQKNLDEDSMYREIKRRKWS